MSKGKLLELQRSREEAGRDDDSSLEITAGAAVTHTPLRGAGGISLAPVVAGVSKAVLKGAPKKKQRGGGAYRDFVQQNIGAHGGDMKRVAAAYRAQKGGGTKEHAEKHSKKHMQVGAGHCEQYMEGGAYWADHDLEGGSWWHSAWSDIADAGKFVAKAAPFTAEIPIIGPEIAAGAETVGRAAQGIGTVGKIFTNS